MFLRVFLVFERGRVCFLEYYILEECAVSFRFVQLACKIGFSMRFSNKSDGPSLPIVHSSRSQNTLS